MAISWGSWVNNTSGNGMRVGIEFTQSPSSVSSGTSSVTVTLRVYVETKASVSDSTNMLSISGDFSWSGSVSISHGSGGGTTLVRTMSRSVSTSYTSTRSTSASVSLSGINAIPGTATESASHTTAKRPVTAPKAPSSVKSTRTGTSIKTSWTRNPTTAQPYDEIRFEQQINGGSWALVGEWSGTSTTHTMTGRSPNSSYRYRVRAQNSAGNSAWAYGPTLTIPPNPPAAPSNATVTRSSDARQVVKWSRGSSPSTAPITQQVIARWEITTGSWKNIATVSGTVSSFTDSSTKANSQYRYRIQSKNSAGTSAWTYTDYIATTPAPPTAVKAQKQGEDIRLTWSLAGTPKSDGIEIWLTQDGVDLPGAQAVLLTGRPTAWTHVSPDPATTWAYRLKTTETATGNETGPKLYSGYSARSNVVQLIAPPSAPTRLTPSATAIDGTDGQLFTWVHNPIDTTDQSAYELDYRVNGGPWIGTGKVASGDSFHEFAPDAFENGTGLEWRVRTWGAHANPSTYSAISVVTVSSRPSVTILVPDGETGTPVVASSSLTAEWEYFDPEDTLQTMVRLSLEDANDSTVWSETLAMSSTSYQIPYTLADGASFTLSISVRDAAGLWSYPAQQGFDVVYAKPPAPAITAVWSLDLGGVVITIEHPAPGPDEAEATSADLQHSADGEEWETIAAGLDPTTSTVDFVPVLDTVNYYRVISYSDLPSSLESATTPVVVESNGWIFVNGGPDWSYICRIRDNVKTDHSTNREKVLNRFAGRPYAVVTTGEARSRAVSISGRTSGGGSTSTQWEELQDLGEPVCYREPGPAYGGSGDKFMAAFMGLSRSRERIFEDVSLTFERVEEV